MHYRKGSKEVDDLTVIGRDVERLEQAIDDHETDHACKGSKCPMRRVIVLACAELLSQNIDLLADRIDAHLPSKP